MTVIRTGAGSSGSTDPAAARRKAKAKVVGDPGVSDEFVREFLECFLDEDLSTEQAAEVALDVYKKAPRAAKEKIDLLFVGKDDRSKGKTSGTSKTSTGKAPADAVNKARSIYKNPPDGKTGDALYVHVLTELRNEFKDKYDMDVLVAARDIAKETTHG